MVLRIKINDTDYLKQRIRETAETVTPDVLSLLWKELKYWMDVCKATNTAHIELHLQHKVSQFLTHYMFSFMSQNSKAWNRTVMFQTQYIHFKVYNKLWYALLNCFNAVALRSFVKEMLILILHCHSEWNGTKI